MNVSDILSKVDHTMLSPTATFDEIKILCDDAIKYGVASVCIAPTNVRRAKEYVGDEMAVCTVIGFPNGYNTTEAKVFETIDAIKNGADEIDMVINVGWVKAKKFDLVLEEIKKIKAACGKRVLKVIIKTCLLGDDEKVKMCEVVTQAGANFIKTSTGFSKAGATFEDVALFAMHVGEGVKIKAAGGISSLGDAEKFISLGAQRLGTSRLVKLAKSIESIGY